jgi:hypothetical protein
LPQDDASSGGTGDPLGRPFVVRMGEGGWRLKKAPVTLLKIIFKIEDVYG